MSKSPFSKPTPTTVSPESFPAENSAEDIAPTIISSHLIVDPTAEPIAAEEPFQERELIVPASKTASRSHPELWLAGTFVAVVCAGAGGHYWQHRNDPPPVAPLKRTVALAPNAQLVSAADTLLIKPSAGAIYSTLRGTTRAAGVVTGQAPMGGQVSRVMFKVGQNVQVGDRILTLTGGPISAAPSGVEHQQDRAEAAQVAAVKGQQKVANQITGAHASYNEAKLRVEAAEKRLVAARTVLSRLRNGETIALPANSPNANSVTANEGKAEPTPRRRARKKSASKVVATNDPQRAAAQRERDTALAASVKAQKAADVAASIAKAAFAAAASAEEGVRTKKTRVESARAALREAENQFAAAKNKASDVDTARGELASAQAEVDEVSDKTKSARDTSDRLEHEATGARQEAQQAAARAAAAFQKLQGFASAPKIASNTETPAPAATAEASANASANANGPRLMTARDAVDLVRDAVAESEAAARNARKWKAQIDTYGDRVKTTSQRIEASSEQLMKAQQRVMDVTIERNLSVVRAPASGIIQSIANVADNVESGDSLVRIGSGRGLEVVFSDSSGLWRRLKPGMTLTAMARAPQEKTPPKAASKTVATPPVAEMPVVLKVREIEAPDETKITKVNEKNDAAKAEPALILAAVEAVPGVKNRSAPSASVRLSGGMGVICSLPAANAQAAIHIPAPAIWRDGNQAMVAVLEPVAPAADTVIPVTQISDSAASGSDLNAAMFRVQWRPIALVAQKAGQNDVQREVLSGLQPGDRILRRATDWRQWSQVNGENATVRVALS